MSAELIVITGTGTGVGKTWVAARLLEGLRARGIPCAARKPVQSFALDDGPTDADVLADASGEEAHVVTPLHRWYDVPMAPPMAAESLGLPPLALADIVAEIKLPDAGVVVVEGVGGPRSPLTDDADTADLAGALSPRAVVLVTGAGLGAINAVLLAAAVFDAPVVVFLNRFDEADDLQRRNRRWLEEVEAFPVAATIPDLLDALDQTPKTALEVR